MANERYQTGLKNLAEIDGEQGDKVIDALQNIAPDFATLLIEFSFGDIYSRPNLDLKSREIATISALTALGNAAPQLKVHLHGALNVGCSPQEIVETLMQMAVYAGFPAALNGLFAAQEVFAERNIDIKKTKQANKIVRVPELGYFVTAELRITDMSRLDETKEALRALCEVTRQESGCRLFELHQCSEEASRLILWECFDSEADFHKHHEMSYTLEYMAHNLTEIVKIVPCQVI